MDHFRRAGATSPETAQTPSALGVEQRFAWERLVDGAVIRTGARGTYYLDEPSWAAMGRRRRVFAIGIAIFMAILAVLIATSASFLSPRR